jgi:hypothetical protein
VLIAVNQECVIAQLKKQLIFKVKEMATNKAKEQMEADKVAYQQAR